VVCAVVLKTMFQVRRSGRHPASVIGSDHIAAREREVLLDLRAREPGGVTQSEEALLERLTGPQARTAASQRPRSGNSARGVVE